MLLCAHIVRALILPQRTMIVGVRRVGMHVVVVIVSVMHNGGDVSQVYDIFVPVEGSFQEKALAPGSALVGEQNQINMIMFYFEGGVHGQFASYEECLFHAADRLAHKYPTVARSQSKRSDLTKVGIYNLSTKKVTILRQDLLDKWLQGSSFAPETQLASESVLDRVYPYWLKARAFDIQGFIYGNWELMPVDEIVEDGDVVLSVSESSPEETKIEITCAMIDSGVFDSETGVLAVTNPNGEPIDIAPLFRMGEIKKGGK